MALVSTRCAFTVSAAALLLACSGAAEAATLSFASDDDSSFFTLSGAAGSGGAFSIRNGRTPAFTPVTLKVDDDNMTQPTFSIAAGLLVNLTATYSGSIGAGSAQTHVYDLTGTFSFVRASDNFPLVNVAVNSGSRLAIGGTGTSWSSAGSMFGSDAASGGLSGVDYDTLGLQNVMSTSGFPDGAYGFSFVNILEDFGFTLTMTNAGGGPVAIDAGTRLPTAPWSAEASYSGHVVGVPAPGAAAGLAVGGLVLARRRRR